MELLKTKTYHVEGVCPLLMHSGQLADSMNPHSLELKKITGKRIKTEADHAEMSRLEWMGGLLLNANREIIIPGEYVEAVLINAAMKSRMGKQCKAGLFCEHGGILNHGGPKDLDKMWATGKYVDRRRVVVQRNAVMRTRPRFDNWKLKFDVTFNTELLNQSQVDEFVVTGGMIIGFGDYRPRYGRFQVIA